MMHPTKETIVEFFKKNRPSGKDKKMLLLNYYAPKHTLTSSIFAKAMGWKNFNAANLHYGGFAGRCATEMGITIDDDAHNIYFFVNFDKQGEGTEESHWHWILRPEFVEAIKELGWDTEMAKYDLEDCLSTAELMLL